MGAARTCFVAVSIFCALVSMIFGILVLIGGVSKPGIQDIYFLRLNTTDFVPTSSSALAALIDAVASDLGLEDYYQTSLWNYCAGNLKNGSTTAFASPDYCSSTNASYWFDPVSIIEDSLSSSITFTVPADVLNDLHKIRTSQHWLKAILVVGTCASFLTLIACTCAFRSRLGSVFATITALIGALFTTVGAVLAQVLGILVRNVINGLGEINVHTTLGKKFYILIWISAGFSLIYFICITFTLCCCSPTGSSSRMRKARRNEGNEKQTTMIFNS